MIITDQSIVSPRIPAPSPPPEDPKNFKVLLLYDEARSARLLIKFEARQRLTFQPALNPVIPPRKTDLLPLACLVKLLPVAVAF